MSGCTNVCATRSPSGLGAAGSGDLRSLGLLWGWRSGGGCKEPKTSLHPRNASEEQRPGHPLPPASHTALSRWLPWYLPLEHLLTGTGTRCQRPGSRAEAETMDRPSELPPTGCWAKVTPALGDSLCPRAAPTQPGPLQAGPRVGSLGQPISLLGCPAQAQGWVPTEPSRPPIPCPQRGALLSPPAEGNAMCTEMGPWALPPRLPGCCAKLLGRWCPCVPLCPGRGVSQCRRGPTARRTPQGCREDPTGVQGLLELDAHPGPVVSWPTDQGRPVERSPTPWPQVTRLLRCSLPPRDRRQETLKERLHLAPSYQAAAALLLLPPLSAEAEPCAGNWRR